MATCRKCKLEIKPGEERVKCANPECGVELHKKCSRKYGGEERYCRKCRTAEAENNPSWVGMQ